MPFCFRQLHRHLPRIFCCIGRYYYKVHTAHVWQIWRFHGDHDDVLLRFGTGSTRRQMSTFRGNTLSPLHIHDVSQYLPLKIPKRTKISVTVSSILIFFKYLTKKPVSQFQLLAIFPLVAPILFFKRFSIQLLLPKFTTVFYPSCIFTSVC
jgi:hypothetical protein